MLAIEKAREKSRRRELRWLVEEIIKPEFPRLIETLHICSDLLLYNSPQHPNAPSHIPKGPGVTLPVSSGKLEELKGIVIREGAHITKVNILLKERHFNRLVTRLQLAKPFLLPQIITAKRSIDTSIELIVQALSFWEASLDQLEQLPHDQVDKEINSEKKSALAILLLVFRDLLKELQNAKNSLQLPIEPELVFPAHVTPPGTFEPDVASRLAIDLYVSQAEVCIDLKELHVVTVKPWSDIDPSTGKSYADQVREQILRKRDVTEREKAETGVLGFFSKLLGRPRYDTQDYIARCVTYNNKVVIVNKKIEVLTADPILVSAFTKLDSVEHMVSRFLENIRKLL